MNICFEGKIVLVTGAGKGIGRATAKAFARSGAIVYALSKTRGDLETLVEECTGIRPLVCDISSVDETEKVVKELGPINILVNCASRRRNEELIGELADFDDMVYTNVRGTLHCCQIAIKSMIAARSSGVIVNVSSISAAIGTRNLGLYAATKAAVDSLTRTLACEHGMQRIRANSVHVGIMKKEDGIESTSDDKTRINRYIQRMPYYRQIEIRDIVDTILFLASNRSEMINGQCIAVDGGYLISGL